MSHKCHNLIIKFEAQNYYRKTQSAFTFKYTACYTFSEAYWTLLMSYSF
jgi:hypothetical protein